MRTIEQRYKDAVFTVCVIAVAAFVVGFSVGRWSTH
jgi:hypothetical protein